MLTLPTTVEEAILEAFNKGYTHGLKKAQKLALKDYPFPISEWQSWTKKEALAAMATKIAEAIAAELEAAENQ